MPPYVLRKVNQIVRYGTYIRATGETKTWTHLRFYERTVYTDFLRHLWAAHHQVTCKRMLVHRRLIEVGYAEPSNFTKFCRQYLGEDYFDNLVDSESDNEADAISSNLGKHTDGRGISLEDNDNGGNGEEESGDEDDEDGDGEEAQVVITMSDTDEYGEGAFGWL